MHSNPELTHQVMYAIGFIVLLISAFLYFNRSDEPQYLDIPEEEQNELTDLIKKSLVSKLTWEDWKQYMTTTGMPESQFNELIAQVNEKLLN